MNYLAFFANVIYIVFRSCKLIDYSMGFLSFKGDKKGIKWKTGSDVRNVTSRSWKSQKKALWRMKSIAGAARLPLMLTLRAWKSTRQRRKKKRLNACHKSMIPQVGEVAIPRVSFARCRSMRIILYYLLLFTMIYRR